MSDPWPPRLRQVWVELRLRLCAAIATGDDREAKAVQRRLNILQDAVDDSLSCN